MINKGVLPTRPRVPDVGDSAVSLCQLRVPNNVIEASQLLDSE
jgi:hypothetical protein